MDKNLKFVNSPIENEPTSLLDALVNNIRRLINSRRMKATLALKKSKTLRSTTLTFPFSEEQIATTPYPGEFRLIIDPQQFEYDPATKSYVFTVPQGIIDILNRFQ